MLQNLLAGGRGDLAAWAAERGIWLFVYLCICVFVYLCICVFVSAAFKICDATAVVDLVAIAEEGDLVPRLASATSKTPLSVHSKTPSDKCASTAHKNNQRYWR